MPHYTLLIRGDSHLPWHASEMSSEDKEWVRLKRFGQINFGVSHACLKVLETEDGKPETVAAAIAELNRPRG